MPKIDMLSNSLELGAWSLEVGGVKHLNSRASIVMSLIEMVDIRATLIHESVRASMSLLCHPRHLHVLRRKIIRRDTRSLVPACQDIWNISLSFQT
jgi:hypothetical protein